MMPVRVWLAVALAGTQMAALPETAAQASAKLPLPWIKPASAARPALLEGRILPAPADPAVLDAQLKHIEAKGESRTVGLTFAGGALENPAQLPFEGRGYYTLRPERNVHHGTDDLVAGLIEACSSLQDSDPAMQPLAVGDISGPRGGQIALHLSHKSGRDADLGFFWLDAAGNPVLTEGFVRFNGRGRGKRNGRTVVFDVGRNWALVRALLANRRFGSRVAKLFVSLPLKTMLLSYAKRHEHDKSLVRRARWILQEPRRPAGRHDDHFHLRIACSPRERSSGCRD